MTATPLEDLLRSHPITNGTIQLAVMNGQWMCSISHRTGHQTHMLGRYSSDPVEALRIALVDDERHGRECRSKYAAAKKLGPPPSDATVLIEDGTIAGYYPPAVGPDEDDFDALVAAGDLGPSIVRSPAAGTATVATVADDFDALVAAVPAPVDDDFAGLL